MNNPEQFQGLTNKWTVVSNKSPTKHAGCDFFVLDLDHDKFAKKALKAYADACRAEYPMLARDIDDRVARMP